MAILLKPKKPSTFKRDIKDQDAKSNTGWSKKPAEKKSTKAQFDISGMSSYVPKKTEARLPKVEVSESTKPAYTDIKKIVSTKEAMAKKYIERKITAEVIKQSPMLTDKQKTEILMSPEKLDENAHLLYTPAPDTVKTFTPQSTASRAWDIVSNPLDAFTYAVSGGGVQNMPHHYSDMEHAGVVDPLTDRNSVAKALEFASYFNPITGLAQGIKAMPYTAQDINKAVKSGKWEDIKKAGESTMYNILDVVPAAAIGKYGRMSDGLSGLGRRTNEFVPNASFNNFMGNRLLPFTSRFESQVPRGIDQTLIGKAFPQLNPNHIKYNPTARAGYNLVADAAKGKAMADATNATMDYVGPFTQALTTPESYAIGGFSLSSKTKELYDFLTKDSRFNKLPQTTNRESLEVLNNFKERIKTTEGQRRLKELGITENELLNNLKIVEDPTTYGYYTGAAKNTIVMHPNHPLPQKVVRHEIEHGVQNALKQSQIKQYESGNYDGNIDDFTKIDDLLSGLELRKEATPNKVWKSLNSKEPLDVSNYKPLVYDKQRATDYFLTGSQGREKSAFLGEVQQYMMDKGIIPKDTYTKVTPEMVKKTFIDAINDEKSGGKYLRLFNIMKPNSANYELVSKGLNKMLSATPLVVGAGAAAALMNNPYKKESMPGLKKGGILYK